MRIDDLYTGLFLFLAGIFILALGAIANIAALYDLSSRAFENRPLDFVPILSLALKRTLWFTLAQYVMICFAMLFGLGIVVGITYSISPILGIFGMLVSVAALVYGFLRSLFSSIALVSEELGPIEAIKRSLELTEGKFWRVLGIGLIGWILATTISAFVRLPFSLAVSPSIDWLIQYIRGNMINVARTFHDLRVMIYSWEGLLLFSSVLTASLMPAFLTTFYYDLRTRKEGALEYPSELEVKNEELRNDTV